MKSRKFFYILFFMSILVIFGVPISSFASGTESFDDAVSVLNVAIANDDMDGIKSLLYDEIGLDVSGNIILSENFNNLIHDSVERDFSFITKDGVSERSSSFEEILWGDSGVFTRISELNLTHNLEIDREDLFEESTMALWEHGELECAVVTQDEDWKLVYLLPDLLYRLSFEEIEGMWYFTQITVRDE